MAAAESEAARLRINDRICLGYQARGAALLSANRPAAAFACLRRQYDATDPGYHLRESMAAVALMAEAAVACGRVEEARRITLALEAVAAITPSPLLEINLLYARAVLAPAADREPHYRDALARDLTRWPWMRSRIQLAYGQWSAQAGRREVATTNLQAALEVFERIGAARWASSARLVAAEPEQSEIGVVVIYPGALIGRDTELAMLRGMIAGVEDEGASVVLRGPPGVGKSSMLRAARAMALAGGAVVLESSGTESQAMPPFAGLQQLLDPLASQDRPLPAIQRHALSTAFGASTGPTPELFLIAMAALTLVVDAAISQPVVLLVDDAQWLDAPTIEVLAFMSRRLRQDPVVMICALRDGHVVPLDDAEAYEIDLAGLDAESSRELLATVAEGLTAADRGEVLDQARGNPLALVELPAAWRSAGSHIFVPDVGGRSAHRPARAGVRGPDPRPAAGHP